MLSRVSFRGATYLPRVGQRNPAARARFLTWKTTGKKVTSEEMDGMLRGSKFMNNMTRVLPGSEKVRVCPLDVEADNELQYPRTVYEGLKNAAVKNTNSNNICGWIDPVTEKLKFLSYDQFFAESKGISMALRELGIGPKDFAAVSWINSKEFLEIMYGTTSLNMVLQPLYPNLDRHAVKYVIKQGEPKLYLCDSESKARLIVSSAKEMPFLKTVVLGSGPPSRDLRNDAQSAGIQLLAMDDFMKLGDNKTHSLA
ncbi:long-chain-fatty-acid--CoA ligase 1-like, partial [Tropilaelaps mercedesae]